MKNELHNNSITFRATDRERTERGTEYADGVFVDMAVEDFERACADGDLRTLATRENVDQDTISEVFLAPADGVPGNADPEIRATEGWRGTTNDVAVFAHGLVRITDVRRLSRGYGYRVAFERVTGSA